MSEKPSSRASLRRLAERARERVEPPLDRRVEPDRLSCLKPPSPIRILQSSFGHGTALQSQGGVPVVPPGSGIRQVSGDTSFKDRCHMHKVF